VLRIDMSSPVPIEEQLAAGLRQALAQGKLAPDQELPSVRQVAADLGIHWNTVARAYRRLADEGLLIVRRGRGVVVRGDRRGSAKNGRASARRHFASAITTGLLNGLSASEMARLFEEALADFGVRERQ
jgi:DNA-binding transcriptional regulator YhcF (GntR family)